MIAFLGTIRLFNKMIVFNKIGVPLAGLAPQEAVVALEAAA